MEEGYLKDNRQLFINHSKRGGKISALLFLLFLSVYNLGF